jgi:hypothetical protein
MCIMVIFAIVIKIAIIVIKISGHIDSQKWNTGLDTGFNRRKAFVHTRARYRSKSIVKARWCVHLLSGLHPSETGVKHCFDPPQVSDADATEQHIRPKVYIRNALLEETSGIDTTHAEQTIAWPKHGDALRSHGTFLHASARAATP